MMIEIMFALVVVLVWVVVGLIQLNGEYGVRQRVLRSRNDPFLRAARAELDEIDRRAGIL